MAVYDPPKQDDDLRKREAARGKRLQDGEPLSAEEQDQWQDLEAGFYDDEFQRIKENYDDDADEKDGEKEEEDSGQQPASQPAEADGADKEGKPSGLYKKTQQAKGRLSKKAKKKVALGGVVGAGLIAILVVIALFLSSLKLPHFMANITAYEFARLGRNFSDGMAGITEEKMTVDLEGGYARSLKNAYGDLRSSTWGKMDPYRPQKVLNNLKGEGRLEYVFSTEERRIFPGTKQVLTGIKIDGTEISLGGDKWYNYFQNRSDRLEFNGRLTAQLQSALEDTNTLVRGQVAQNIRDELGIKLRRWERLTKTYRSAKEAEAAEIKLTAEQVDETPSERSIVDPINDATESAEETADNCLESEECLERQAATDVEDLQKTTAEEIGLKLNSSALNTVAHTASTAYAVMLPLCMIYDGSIQRSGSTVDASSNRSVKMYYTLAAAADQQKDGAEASASQIGGLNTELGDITNAPSETRAYGKTVNTNHYTSPQANGTQDFSIISVFLGDSLAGAISTNVLNTVCPAITNPYVGIGAGILEFGAVIISGGTIEGAEAPIKAIVSEMASQVFSKEGLTELGTKFARDSVLVVGGSILANILVRSRLGNQGAGIPNSHEMQVQADQGANIHSGDVDRQMLYGRPMDTPEIVESNYQDYQDVAFENSQKSIYDRYLSPDNPTSALANTAVSLNMTFEKSIPNLIQGLVSKVGDLFSPDKSLMAVLNGGSHSRVMAATANSNYNIVQWGWTAGEEQLIENNPTKYSPINNGETMERSGQLNTLKTKYNKCFTATIGTLLKDGDINRDQDGKVLADDALCSPKTLGPAGPNDGEAFKYRIYMRNQNLLDHASGIQNPTASRPQRAASAGGSTVTPPSGNYRQAGKPLPGLNTDGIEYQCPTDNPNISDAGVVNDSYISGTRYNTRLCWVYMNGHTKRIRFNTMISREYAGMWAAFNQAGFTLDSTDGDGYRTYATQQAGYNANPGNFARPGYSNHEYGAALDIRCSGGGGPVYVYGGKGSRSDGGLGYFLDTALKSPCLNWIHQNSANYGLLLQCDGKSANGGPITGGSGGACEPWHISPTGG